MRYRAVHQDRGAPPAVAPSSAAKVLQGLSQAHVVSQDAATAIEVFEAHEAIEKKLHLKGAQER